MYMYDFGILGARFSPVSAKKVGENDVVVKGSLYLDNDRFTVIATSHKGNPAKVKSVCGVDSDEADANKKRLVSMWRQAIREDRNGLGSVVRKRSVRAVLWFFLMIEFQIVLGLSVIQLFTSHSLFFALTFFMAGLLDYLFVKFRPTMITGTFHISELFPFKEEAITRE